MGIQSLYPRIQNPQRMEKLGDVGISEGIRFMKPFGFLDYVHLQMNAACVLSDSGTICEESSILGFPAVTIRNAIERPEAMDAGSIIVTGLDPEVILASVKMQMSEDIRVRGTYIPEDYRIDNTSHRVVKLIVGTAKLSNLWNGIEYNDLV